MNKSKDLKDRILQMREDNSIEVSSEMKVLDKTKLQSIEKVDVKDKTLEKKNIDISYNQSQQAFMDPALSTLAVILDWWVTVFHCFVTADSLGFLVSCCLFHVHQLGLLDAGR